MIWNNCGTLLVEFGVCRAGTGVIYLYFCLLGCNRIVDVGLQLLLEAHSIVTKCYLLFHGMMLDDVT